MDYYRFSILWERRQRRCGGGGGGDRITYSKCIRLVQNPYAIELVHNAKKLTKIRVESMHQNNREFIQKLRRKNTLQNTEKPTIIREKQ